MTDASTPAAVGFAIYAGVLTFFSPCAYPLLPGYVGFYVSRDDGRSTLPGALARGLVAGAGVLVVLGAFLGSTFLVGRSAFERLTLLEPAVGAALIVIGVLVALDRAPSLSIPLPRRRAGLFGFAAFGAGYAVAAAGCVAPVFLAVVSLGLAAPGGGGAAVLGAYVGTVVALMVALTVATGVGLVAGGGWVAANRGRLERLAGVLLVLAGIGQLYVAYAVEYTF